MTRSLGWTRELAAAAGFLLVSGTGRASAQIERPRIGWDVGVYIGYHFGGGARRRIAVGLEGRGVYGELSPFCREDASRYAAVVARIGLVGREPRLVTAVQGGLRAPALGAAGEVGVGFDLAPSVGLFVQPGLEASVMQIFTFRVHHAFGSDTSVSFGARGGPGSEVGCVVLN